MQKTIYNQIGSFTRKLFFGKNLYIWLLILFASMAFLFYQFFILERQVNAEKQDQDSEYMYSWADVRNQIYENPDSARFTIRSRIDHLEQEGSTDEIIRAYYLLATAYAFESNYIRSMEYFRYALDLAIKANAKTSMSHIYNNMGISFGLMGNYHDALDMLFKGLRDAEPGEIEATILNNIGRIYLELNDIEKSEHYLNQARQVFAEKEWVYGLISVYNHLGEYYSQKDIADSAFYYYDKSIQLGLQHRQYFILAEVLYGQGETHLRLNDHKAAKKSFQKSDSIAQLTGYLNYMCQANYGLSNVFIGVGDLEQASHHAGIGNAMAKDMNNEFLQYKFTMLKSQIHEKLDNVAEAFSYYKLADKLREELHSKTAIQRIYNIELEHFQREMEIRDHKMETEQLLLSKQKNRMTLIAIISVLAIIVFSLFFLYFINKTRQAQKEKLQNENIKHTYEKNRSALEAELQERKRLGLELHDGVGSIISLTKLSLTHVLEGNINNAQRKEELINKAVENLDEILNEIKHISYNLAPLVLIEKGFDYALREYVSMIQGLNYFKINYKFRGLRQHFNGYISHALYRTVQELFNNIVLHAQAAVVHFEVIQNEEEIRILIQDDGCGFDSTTNNHKGLGLKSAVSRIECLQGSLVIDSEPGKGTFIEITVPSVPYLESVSLKQAYKFTTTINES